MSTPTRMSGFGSGASMPDWASGMAGRSGAKVKN
jgi:hypothetical protein